MMKWVHRSEYKLLIFFFFQNFHPRYYSILFSPSPSVSLIIRICLSPMSSSSSSSSPSSTANYDTLQYGIRCSASYVIYPNISLLDCALIVLNEPDPLLKAEKTFGIYKAYQEKLLSLTKPTSTVLSLPDKPARPAYVNEVDARKVKSNSKKGMIHAVVHAESYAIDLAWDVIARYGYNPELWIIPDDIRITINSTVSVVPVESKQLSLSQAPTEFFDDWIKVAYEEAIHFTRWRLRLQELGSKYGDLPGHAGLWESAEETSAYAISRMAIVHCVHEARGLDVAPIMRSKFEKSQDYPSIEILDLNHADEIGHVRFGKKWFEWFLQYNQVGLSPVLSSTTIESSSLSSSSTVIEIFHKFVKKYFRGILRPPFNEKSRHLAGFTSGWYLPLSTTEFSADRTVLPYGENITEGEVKEEEND